MQRIHKLIILSYVPLFTSACFFNSNPVPPLDSDTDSEEFIDWIDGTSCGNGILEGGEECDDGNGVDGDGCDNDCTYTCSDDSDCNDGNVCNGEETCNLAAHTCEEGTPIEDGLVCLEEPRRICLGGECAYSVCGDGFVDTGGGESCEPPNEGRCGPDCTLSCEGDGDCPDDGNICNGSEYCNLETYECTSRDPLEDGVECGADPRRICIAQTCQESICGDSFTDVAVGEECDDGLNGNQDDGCRDDCTYSCHNDLECEDGQDCSVDVCDVDATHACVYLLAPATLQCRPTAGTCDRPELCDGINMNCPPDTFEPDTTQCRPSNGVCDVAEYCTGSSSDCPADSFEPSSTVCRASTSGCDPEETCTGTGPDCPVDIISCLDLGDPCSHWSECTSGHCVDDVCCDSPCNDQVCQRCDAFSVNGAGYCGYVGGFSMDPDNDCSQGSTAADGCSAADCSGSGYSCGVESGGDGGCPLCYTCSGADVSCDFHPSGFSDDGCLACKVCDGAGSCTQNAPDTGWGDNEYGCVGSDRRCFNGECRQCGGYISSDMLGGFGCWYDSGTNGLSCTEACSTHGGCVETCWNDSDTCIVCRYFYPGATCSSRSDNNYEPTYNPILDQCRWRRGADCQYCDTIRSDRTRICNCNY